MAAFLTTAMHDGTPWVILAFVIIFAGVAFGLFTRTGSEIDYHPYAKGGNGGDLGTDLPAEETGRDDLEPILWPKRAGRRKRRTRS
jgi:hypothetical protein